jgi:hypothetical protein
MSNSLIGKVSYEKSLLWRPGARVATRFPKENAANIGPGAFLAEGNAT